MDGGVVEVEVESAPRFLSLSLSFSSHTDTSYNVTL